MKRALLAGVLRPHIAGASLFLDTLHDIVGFYEKRTLGNPAYLACSNKFAASSD